MSNGAKPSLRRSVFGVAAMVLTALLTVSVSLPARAVNVTASGPFESAASAATTPTQSLSVSPEAIVTVARDGFTSKAKPKPKPKPKPAATAAAPSVSGGPAVLWPFPGRVPIAGGYGPRAAPCGGCSTFHKGLDMNPGVGTPVRSVAAGVVRSATPYDNGGFGVHVIIDHQVGGRLVSSVYAHMQTGSLTVGQGQAVAAGQTLGRVGSTGQSTGPHLHLEILLGGVTPTDPYAWLTARAGPP